MQIQQTVIIAANNVVRVERAGKVFAVISATAAFQVRPAHGSNMDMAVGRGFGNPGAEEVGFLTLSNTSGVAVTVTFYWGYEVYHPDPAQFSGSFTTTATQANQPTYTTGSGELNILAGGDSANFTGVNGPDRRKQFAVTNLNKPVLDPSATIPDTLQIKGSDGSIVGRVFPQQTFTLESGGLFTIHNPMAVAVDYIIAEVWYDF